MAIIPSPSHADMRYRNDLEEDVHSMSTNRLKMFWVVMLGLIGAAMPLHAEAGYLVQIDDVLHIQVMGEESLTNSFTVSPDGKIPFPMIGEVDAENKTLIDISHSIRDRL